MQTAAHESRYKLNQSVESGTHDLANALKNEEGTFEVTHGDQSFRIRCTHNDAIVSFTPSENSSGSRSSPLNWIITRKSESSEEEGPEHQSRSAKA